MTYGSMWLLPSSAVREKPYSSDPLKSTTVSPLVGKWLDFLCSPYLEPCTRELG